MKVNAGAMLANLKSTRGLIMSESVMIALVGKGMDRQDAHELLRVTSAKAVAENRDLHDVHSEDPKVKKLMTKKELAAALDYAGYTGDSAETVERLAKKLRPSRPARS
jgi:adenylosuccinate lyase